MALEVKYHQNTTCYCDNCGKKNTNVRLISLEGAAGIIAMSRMMLICVDCMSHFTNMLTTPVGNPSPVWSMTGIDIISWASGPPGANGPIQEKLREMKECFDEVRMNLEQHKIVKGTYVRKAMKVFDSLYESQGKKLTK